MGVSEEAYKCIGVKILWKGKDLNEIGIDKKTNKTIVKIDKYYFRPTEVNLLLGDPSKAKKLLNWEPKISIEELISEMIEGDSKESKKESILKNKGFSMYSSKE